jgi:hypothetical protein
VFADLNDGPLAHLPSGHFGANSAWALCAAIAHNLLHFLRARREAMQPDDVGLPRGRRRRAAGLRREELAALCDISADYYRRIEQRRGPVPSEQVLASIASGMHFSLDERDHVFRLAGYALPRRVHRSDHVSRG